jgi:hypothetical protein
MVMGFTTKITKEAQKTQIAFVPLCSPCVIFVVNPFLRKFIPAIASNSRDLTAVIVWMVY